MYQNQLKACENRLLVSDSLSRVWSLITDISNKFPVGVDSVGEGPHFKDQCSYVTSFPSLTCPQLIIYKRIDIVLFLLKNDYFFSEKVT